MVFSKDAPTKVNIQKWRDFFQSNPTAYAALSFIEQNYGGSIHRPQCLNLAKQAVSLSQQDLFRFYLAVMIWGWGNQGRGKHFTRLSMNDSGIQAKLVNMIALLKNNDVDAAYNEFKLAGCGPAYFTKLFYFLGKVFNLRPLPVILDANVARTLEYIDASEGSNYLADFVRIGRNENGEISCVNRFAPGYLKFIEAMDGWATTLGCTADQIECFMYRDRGSMMPFVQLTASQSSLNNIPKSTSTTNSDDFIVTELPLSTDRINGVIHIRKGDKPSKGDKAPKTWECYVGGDDEYSKYGTSDQELDKLPEYPITHLKNSKGIGVYLKNGDSSCPAAFHGYEVNNRYKHRHFYIGSRGKWKNGRQLSKQYRDFLASVFNIVMGIDKDPVPVIMEFCKSNIIRVAPRSTDGD